MLKSMTLEILDVSLVIPALALPTQQDIALRYLAFQPVLDALGNPSQQTLVIGGMLVLVGVSVKTAFCDLTIFMADWHVANQ